MAVQNLTLPSFPTFSTSAEVSALFTQWNKYKKRFTILCSAVGVTDDAQKLSMLLTYIGDDAYDIYEQIMPAGRHTLTEVFTAFDNHFKPQANSSYETYLFHQIRQRTDETIHQYYIRLKEHAGKCDFHDLNLAIKQQIELHTNNNKLRRYSFQNPGKTLQELLAMGKTFEVTKLQTEVLENATHATGDINNPINVINKTPDTPGNNFTPNDATTQKYKTCYNCGGTYPHQKFCPAEGKPCYNCGKSGHFSRCCKSNPNNRPKCFSNVNTPPRKVQWGVNQRTRGRYNKPLNNIRTSESLYEENYSSDDHEYLFTLPTVDCINSTHENSLHKESQYIAHQYEARNLEPKQKVLEQARFLDFVTTLNIEKQPVDLLVDSGASVNIMNRKTFAKLNTPLRKPLKVEKSKTKVVTYGADTPFIKIEGEVKVLVETAEKFLITKFHIVNTDHQNLLSGVSALALGLIELRNSNVNTCNVIRENTKPHFIPNRITTLIDSFRETVFSGQVGKLKNYQVHLKIKPGVTPVAQKERRIPFALRQKVNQEIRKLEAAGIVEDVTNEATPWINPLVVVPKSGDDIRLCIDMRCANKAVERIRYPIPTIDDVMIKIRGCKVFTKLDLNSAFHQLELSPDSRSITTFQSDTRIKRFTRLIFGVNSAQEELQHALQDVLRDIEGTTNIADDILLFAENHTKHDEILLRVLQRLQEKGLTLNLSKCVFGQERLKFYGYIFSSQGIQPNPDKLEEIKSTPPPENAKALQSFLGLMNYFKRFIPQYSTITYPLRQLLKRTPNIIGYLNVKELLSH